MATAARNQLCPAGAAAVGDPSDREITVVDRRTSALSSGPSREQLLRDGYTVASQVLPPAAVERNLELARRILTRQAEEYRRRHVSIGSLFDLLAEPDFVELIGWPATMTTLAALGFSYPRFQHGIVFNKPPRTPRTFWHQDGTMWNHAVSYEDRPLDLILIYYLIDTRPANGCLRVIPGSHRRRHPLHDGLSGTCTPELRRMQDPDSPAFQIFPDEVAVPVKAGDVVVTDARLLHAAHANESDADRTALSLWYLSAYEELPEVVRARYTLTGGLDSRLPYLPDHWPESARERLRTLLPPPYRGTAPPLPMHNAPGPDLR